MGLDQWRGRFLPSLCAVIHHYTLAKKMASHRNFSMGPAQFPATVHAVWEAIVLDSFLDSLSDYFQIRKWENPGLQHSNYFLFWLKLYSLLQISLEYKNRFCETMWGRTRCWVIASLFQRLCCVFVCTYEHMHACPLAEWGQRHGKLLFSTTVVTSPAFEMVYLFSVCVQVCRGQRLTSAVFLYYSPPCFQGGISHWAWSLQIS